MTIQLFGKSFDDYVKVTKREYVTYCPKCKSENTLYDNTICMCDICLDCQYRARKEKCFPVKERGLFIQ